MTFQIEITRNGHSKLLGNPLAGRPHSFNVREDAEHFAKSCLRSFVMHWKNQGIRAPKYRIIEVRA